MFLLILISVCLDDDSVYWYCKRETLWKVSLSVCSIQLNAHYFYECRSPWLVMGPWGMKKEIISIWESLLYIFLKFLVSSFVCLQFLQLEYSCFLISLLRVRIILAPCELSQSSTVFRLQQISPISVDFLGFVFFT